jgi:hypothetical protein
LANIGCTENSSSADRKIVPVNTPIRIRLVACGWSVVPELRGWVADMPGCAFFLLAHGDGGG